MKTRQRKQPLITRLLWLAVFGKEDILHTLPLRSVKMRSVTIPTRGKA